MAVAGDPIELTQTMWNHSGAMYAEMQQKKISWPQLSSQDLTDLLVYFRNLPEPSRAPVDLHHHRRLARRGAIRIQRLQGVS